MRAIRRVRLFQRIAISLAAMALLAVASAGDEIELRPVRSSNIDAIGYDYASRVLLVRFRSGAAYRYSEVPVAVFADFLEAESKGRFFARQIRSRYAFERLTAPKP